MRKNQTGHLVKTNPISTQKTEGRIQKTEEACPPSVWRVYPPMAGQKAGYSPRSSVLRSGWLRIGRVSSLYPVRKPALWVETVFFAHLITEPRSNTPTELSNGVYKPGNDQYYSRHIGRCSSTVEHGFRKAGVVGSNPTIGFMNLQEKFNSLQEILKKLGKVIVAYSGGVDSTFLLKAAVDTLGVENVLACISAGPVEPKGQLDRAEKIAISIGARLKIIEADELSDPNFTANKADRCFHCKSHLCRILLDIAKEQGFKHVIFGTNYDDLDDYRPGNRAMKVFGIRSPLAEAKLTKSDIRQLSRELGLPTADLPASPCLASRIAYGLEVTEQRLKQIDEAENFLRSLGFVEFRVRHHDTIARIEVNPQDIVKVTTEPLRSRVVNKMKSLGFKFVTVDLQGFRSGSLNEPLSEEEKRKSL
jgi:uncharacterized protein